MSRKAMSVRRDDEAMLLKPFLERAIRPVIDVRVEVRSEFHHLVFPVTEHRRRTDDEEADFGCLPGKAMEDAGHQGHDLMGLAQTHVVAQETGEPIFIEKPEPPVPIPLVRLSLPLMTRMEGSPTVDLSISSLSNHSFIRGEAKRFSSRSWSART